MRELVGICETKKRNTLKRREWKSLTVSYSTKLWTWNIRSINQGKIDMAKQAMVTININILAISELKWIRKGEFNPDCHYIYYCGQESLRRTEVALIVNKRAWNAALGCNLKDNRMISVPFQGKPFSITVIQIYTPTINAEEAEVEWLYEDLPELLDLILPKQMSFSL